MAVLDPLDVVLRALRGHPLTSQEREAFARYLDLLMLWNRTHDLTACRTPGEVVTDLLRDSLLFLAVLPDLERIVAVDIGAGAGIPGIPLRLTLPSLELTLIESRRKRVSFLRAAQRELGLTDVRIMEGRAERIVSEHMDIIGKYDVALSRGVAAGDLLKFARPYLKPGGSVIAGGPPRPGPVPPSSGYSDVAWRQITIPPRRTSRTFLVARG